MDINLAFNSDVGDPNFGSCDITFDTGDQITSAVLMSLFCFRRCTKPELQDGTDQNGWWVDTKSQKWGSKLWLLHRRKITTDLIPTIRQYIVESLKWMIDDGICTSIDAQVAQNPTNFNAIQAQVQLNRERDNIVLTLNDLWAYAQTKRI
jgi:phage gp46-like protein